METTQVTSKNWNLVEATNKNIEVVFDNIQNYASQKDYRISGDLKLNKGLLDFKSKPSFESRSQEKALRWYLTRLEKKVTMITANRFLHFLYKKVYKLDQAPKVLISEKEQKIQDAKKAWKKIQVEANKLLLAYKVEKGDFYKKK